MMKKSIYSISSLVILILFSCGSKTTKEEKSDVVKQPNIIYILADDLGYGDIQKFNSEGKIPTPNLNSMAENGVMFTDAHTSSSVCTPTRYGIITGRYNWRSTLKSGVVSGYSKSLIKPNRTTVADMLKSQGYNTAFIGKWHMGWDWSFEEGQDLENLDKLSFRPIVNYKEPIKNGPSTHGFDYYFGFCGSLDMPPYVFVENDTIIMRPTKTTVSVDRKSSWRQGPTSDDFVHANILQDLTDKAVGYISKKADDDNPFFLYFPLPAPHTPILPTTEFLGKSNTNMYGDFVMQVDDVVRQIRETLKAKGISENTMLVFTSDNGCSPTANFGELNKVDHKPNYVFRGMKSDIYEGGHHVPFIVEWPNKALKNTSTDKTISTTDFFATCAEITGYKIKETEAVDSYSMLPLLTSNSQKDIREYIVYHSVDGSFAIKSGDWKLCLIPGSGGWSFPRVQQIKKDKNKFPDMQLFNIKNDIEETNNLIASNPEIAKELKRALKEIILNGRSTDGEVQENDETREWKQVETIIK